MIEPDKCQTITEVRNEIDRIDKEIVTLIGTRFDYVKEIIRFKSNEEDVHARERYNHVMQKRREWAVENNLNPDVIESIYKTMVQYFIDEQLKMLNTNKTNL